MNKKLLGAACLLAATFSSASAQQGMTVVRDPATGQLRAPTADELRELHNKRAQTRIAPATPQSTVRPDGTRKLELGERGMVYSVITRAPNGQLKRDCIHAKDAVDALQKHEEAKHGHP